MRNNDEMNDVINQIEADVKKHTEEVNAKISKLLELDGLLPVEFIREIRFLQEDGTKGFWEKSKAIKDALKKYVTLNKYIPATITAYAIVSGGDENTVKKIADMM